MARAVAARRVAVAIAKSSARHARRAPSTKRTGDVLHDLARLLRKRGELGEAKVLVHISCIASTGLPSEAEAGPRFVRKRKKVINCCKNDKKEQTHLKMV